MFLTEAANTGLNTQFSGDLQRVSDGQLRLFPISMLNPVYERYLNLSAGKQFLLLHAMSRFIFLLKRFATAAPSLKVSAIPHHSRPATFGQINCHTSAAKAPEAQLRPCSLSCIKSTAKALRNAAGQSNPDAKKFK